MKPHLLSARIAAWPLHAGLLLAAATGAHAQDATAQAATVQDATAQAATVQDATAQAATAQGPHHFSANIALVNNYIFRGISYTQNRPALQGGFDYTHDSGFYLGTWASNVSPKAINDADLEWDAYGGYTTSFGDWSIDAGLFQFYYPERPRLPGTREKYQTLELYGSVTWRWLTLKYSSTMTDFFGFNQNSLGGTNGNSRGSGYLDLSAQLPLPAKFTLGLHVGHQTVRHYSDYNYTDWRLTLARDLGDGWNVMTGYTGTNANDQLWVTDGKKVGAGHWFLQLQRKF